MRGPGRLFGTVVLAGFALAGGCNCNDPVPRDAGSDARVGLDASLPDAGPPDVGTDARDAEPDCGPERVLCCPAPPDVDEACCDFGCIL